MHSFRLVTAIESIGVTEPVVISPDIEEPVKWADVMIQGESDPKLHGFLYNYAEEGIKLQFTCESAHSLISQQYYTFGSDLDIRFQLIFTNPNGTEDIDFDGVLQGDSIMIEAGKVHATVLEKSIHQVVDSRFDTPIALDSWKTLDGKALTPPSWVDLTLPGQALKQKLEVNNIERKEFAIEAPESGAIGLFAVPNTTKAIKPNETPIDETVEGFKESTGEPLIEDPIKSKLPVMDAVSGGDYNFVFKWVYRIDVSLTKKGIQLTASKFLNWKISSYLVVEGPDGNRTVTSIAPVQQGSGEKTHLGTRTVEANFSGTLKLQKGSKVAFFSYCTFSANGEQKRITVNLTSLQVYLSITALTRAESSVTKVWRLADAIRHVIRCITNQSNIGNSVIDPVISDLLDYGPASEYTVTNGASLRGVPKAPTFSLKQLMGLLSAFDVAGLQYKGNRVQIEAGDYFFQDQEIVRVDTVFEYREEVATEHLYNQVDCGYDKYPDSGPGVREEFNTIRTYQTPLKNYGQKLEIKSPLIGAGTAIEQVRTVQFSKQPTDSHAYDDDGFVLHVQSAIYSNLVRFETLDAQSFPGPSYQRRVATFFLTSAILRAGSTLTFNSGVGAGMTILITAVLRRSIILGTQVEFLTNDPVPNTTAYEMVTFQAGNEPNKIRNDERLQIVGLSDPATVVNAELSPARIIRRHAPFLLNGLKYKPLSDELRCTFFAQNGEMYSKVRPESPALPGDPFKQTIYESGPVAIGELDKQPRLFSPEWIFFKGILEREYLKRLLAGLSDSSLADPSVRNGYVTVINPDGLMVTGWVRMGGYIRYNPCSEVVEIKMLKRYQPLTEVDCDLYRDKTYTDFENDPTINQQLYLFCQFLEFQ